MSRFYTRPFRLLTPAALLSVFISFLVYAYSGGITGATKKNGDGCNCHNPTPSGNVTVVINGPSTVQTGSTNEYTVSITGGPLTRGGTNIAAMSGTLNTVNTDLQKIGAELTHTQPKSASSGSVVFTFSYTAPGVEGPDTLYANGNSVNFNGQNSGDEWSYALNFPVQVLTSIPVELASFNSSVAGNSVELRWETITEKNNYGFNIERKIKDGGNWVQAGFIKGAGTSTVKRLYSFSEVISEAGSYQYRIKQIDMDGSSTEYLLQNDVEITTPEQFTLFQNYPNPFNPSTVIAFSVPVDADVRLSVYNLLGKEVTLLVNEFRPAGYYTVPFNSLKEKLSSSGVYFYKVEAVGRNNNVVYSDVKKMILLK